MKRYGVFAGENYYPIGGMDDFISDHDDENEAIEKAKSLRSRSGWSQVYDFQEMIEVLIA